jgi:hypothetical protein
VGTKISIEIDNCKSCPFFKAGPPYSTDGWDRMEDWLCTNPKADKGKPKKIQGAVEWHEEDGIKVPDWCPIKQ